MSTVINETPTVRAVNDAPEIRAEWQNQPGADGPAGATGPNSIDDSTDLGTLTAIADALFLLAGRADGLKPRKITLAAIHRAILAAADAAGVRSAIGTDAAGDTRPPAAHTHPLSALTQSGATSGQVPAWNGSTWAPATVSGGGAAGDMLSVLTSAENSVTGATTLTLNRMHVCSGTSSDYTVTLPAASGNAGRFVGVRMATGLTRLITIDGNGSETIDGSLTRVMWAGESAILLCDGSNWFKVAGRSLPMRCRMRRLASLAIGNLSTTTVQLDQTVADNTGSMADLANGRISIRRDGTYLCAGSVVFNLSSAATYCEAQLRRSGAFNLSDSRGSHTAAFVGPSFAQSVSFTAGQNAQLAGYQNSGASASLYVTDPVTFLDLLEIPAW